MDDIRENFHKKSHKNLEILFTLRAIGNKKAKKDSKNGRSHLFFLGMRKNEFKSENDDEDLLTSQPLVPTKYMHSTNTECIVII